MSFKKQNVTNEMSVFLLKSFPMSYGVDRSGLLFLRCAHITIIFAVRSSAVFFLQSLSVIPLIFHHIYHWLLHSSGVGLDYLSL